MIERIMAHLISNFVQFGLCVPWPFLAPWITFFRLSISHLVLRDTYRVCSTSEWTKPLFLIMDCVVWFAAFTLLRSMVDLHSMHKLVVDATTEE